MARLDYLPWYKRWYWTCYLLFWYYYYKVTYLIKCWFKDKWLSFKCRKESAEVRKKYIETKLDTPEYKKILKQGSIVDKKNI